MIAELKTDQDYFVLNEIDADTFGISFPINLQVEMKAVLIGACFLIVSSVATFLLGNDPKEEMV